MIVELVRCPDYVGTQPEYKSDSQRQVCLAVRGIGVLSEGNCGSQQHGATCRYYGHQLREDRSVLGLRKKDNRIAYCHSDKESQQELPGAKIQHYDMRSAANSDKEISGRTIDGANYSIDPPCHSNNLEISHKIVRHCITSILDTNSA